MELTRKAKGLFIFCTFLVLSMVLSTKDTFAATIQSFSTSSSTVNIDLSPSATTSSSNTGSHTATIKTNCDSGYRIYVSMASDSEDNKLHLNGKDSNNTSGTNAIGPTSGSIASASALGTNTWGVKVGSSNVFGAVPLYSDIHKYTGETTLNPAALISSSSAALDGTNYTITYGANATSSLNAGYYFGNVLYTAIMDSSCYTAPVTINKEANVFSTSGVTTGNYPINSSQTVTCTPEAGYSCTWYNGDTQVSSTNSYNFSVPANGITLTAKATPNRYNINIDKNGGTDCMTSLFANVAFNSTIHIDPCSADIDKAFIGYAHSASATEPDYRQSDEEADVSTIATVAGVQNQNGALIQLYAVYTTKTYQVKFNACNGTGSMNNQTFTYGVEQNLYINAYSRENYEFAGWNRTGCYLANSRTNYIDYTQAQNVMNLTTAHDYTVNLYAVWTPYAYSYNDNDEGDAYDIYLADEYNHEHGWYCDDDERPECPFKVGERIYLTPMYDKSRYRLNGYTVTGIETGNIYDYIVDYDENLEPYLDMPNEPILIKADVYSTAAQSHNVTINKDAHITSTTGQGTNYTGQTVDVSATAEIGYHVKNWSATPYVGISRYNNRAFFTMPDNDVTLSVTSEPNTYYVKFNGCSNTGGSMNDQVFTYGIAQNLSSNAFSRTDYVFGGWSSTGCNQSSPRYSNGQNVNNLTTTNSGTFNLYAVWKPKVIAFDDDEYGDKYDIYLAHESEHDDGDYCDDGSEATCYFYPGEKVYIHAEENIPNLYLFTSWQVETIEYGDGIDVNSETSKDTWFIMPNEPVMVSANTRGIEYTIDFNKGGCTGVTGDTEDMTMYYGVAKNLTRSGYERTYYQQAGWNRNRNSGLECFIDSTSVYNITYRNGQSVINLASEEGDTVDLYPVWTPGAYAYDDGNNGDYVDIYLSSEDEYNEGEYCDEGEAAYCFMKAGQKVYITTGWVKTGYRFKNWTVTTRESGTVISVNSSTSPTTYFTMPSEPVLIRATMEVIPPAPATYTVTVRKGGNVSTVDVTTGPFQAGAQVQIQAKAFAANYTFDSWTVNEGNVTLGNSKAATTTFTMPAKNVIITANARPMTLTDISTMQAINSTICSNTTIGVSNTLEDTRNSTDYLVKKLSDGRCWMQSPLKIANKTLTTSDSNVLTTFTLPDSSSPSAFTEKNGKNTAILNTTLNTNAYFYNFYAATAGTSYNSTTAQPAADICPKNWKMPSQSEFATLVTYYSTEQAIINAGFGRYGWINVTKYKNYPNSGMTEYALYRAATSTSQGKSNTLWARSSKVTANDTHDKHDGVAIQCVAKN